MTTRVLSPRECVSQAMGNFILDFRTWLIPETKLLTRWKTQKYAYAVAEGKLVDDLPSMLDSLRKKAIDFPILVYAVRQISAPPELSQVLGTHHEIKTVIPSDPLKRRVLLRTEPRVYHVQFLFLSNDVDSANAFTSQFCSYIRLMEKRRFEVNYFLSPDLRDKWHLTILDNSIYPDTADLEDKNIVAGLLDFDLSGLVPRVTKGLPQLYPDDFGDGSGIGGDATNPNHPNYGDGDNQQGWGIVIEADLFKDRDLPTFKRLYADEVTGERSSATINKDEGTP